MSYLLGVADAVRLPLPDQSVDLVFGSPPYLDARSYGIQADRRCDAWVEWMLRVSEECLRVSRGAVCWVVAGTTRKRDYQPGPEGLSWEWRKRGGSQYRPVYWRRNGIAGSGGDQWFRCDVETILCFKRSGKLPYAQPTTMGHPPKWRPGGVMTNRRKNGRREYTTKAIPKIANPGNLIYTRIGGGGHLGHPLAHENEAPFPTLLPRWFIKTLTRKGDVVLDPFSGSGTTIEVARELGRVGLGFDLRASQAELAERRLNSPYTTKAKRRPDLPGQSLFSFVGKQPEAFHDNQEVS